MSEAIRKKMGCRRSTSMVEDTEIFRGYRDGIGVCADYSVAEIDSLRLVLADFCPDEEIVR